MELEFFASFYQEYLYRKRSGDGAAVYKQTNQAF